MIDFLGDLFGPLVGLMGSALRTSHALGAPWWLCIVFLTVAVRALLSPLTLKQVRSTRAMQELRPEMEEIRSRYEDDQERQQQAMIELYRERRVNPLASFLPLLVQVPVFITMYRVIRHFEETLPGFSDGGLWWFTDLTRADPTFALPIISASILVVAGEISARSVAPSQRRLMRLLPVAFTAFIARFPAGLFVYWITSNMFTLLQNLLIYRSDARRPGAKQPSPPNPGEDAEDSRKTEPRSGAPDPVNDAPPQKSGKSRAARRRKNRKKGKR